MQRRRHGPDHTIYLVSKGDLDSRLHAVSPVITVTMVFSMELKNSDESKSTRKPTTWPNYD